jgi:uncharacterized phiE125 gp8 family phage protein
MLELTPIRVTGPASQPVTLAEAKSLARIDTTDEDVLVGFLIEVATTYLDGWSGALGRAILTQTWRQDFTDFEQGLRLIVGPVQSITSIVYRDQSNTDVTLNSSLYTLLRDNRGAFVHFDPETWPTVYDRPDAVRITYVCGEATAKPDIKHLVCLLVGQWFAHRETIGQANTRELEYAVKALASKNQFGFMV